MERQFFNTFYFSYLGVVVIVRLNCACIGNKSKGLLREVVAVGGLLRETEGAVGVGGVLFLAVTKVVGTFKVAVFLGPIGLCSDKVSNATVLTTRLAPRDLSLSLFLVVFGLPLFLFKLGGRKGGFAFCTVCAITICSFIS